MGKIPILMAYSHYRGPELGRVQKMGPDIWILIYCEEMFTLGLRQGKELGSIVSYCTGPVPRT